MIKLLNSSSFLAAAFSRDKYTVEYYFYKHMHIRKYKNSTILDYTSIYKRYIVKYAKLHIKKINRHVVEQIRKDISHLYCNSQRHVISLFRCILQCAIIDKKIKKNIFDDIKIKRRQPKKEPHPFTREEMNLLLYKSDGWFKNFLAFLFFTGARIGEVAALDWEDINEASIYVTKHIYKNVIDVPKTYKPRRVPVLKELKPFIKAQKKITKTGRVFPNVKGACSLFYRWHALLKKCGMENNRILYQTRHTFAITALDKGVKISELCYILGHSNPDMLYKHYARYIEPLKFTNFSMLK